MKNGNIWFRSLIAAFIGGGAGSISSGLTASQFFPDQVNLGPALFVTLKFMAATFIVSGVIAVAAFLKQSPVPPGWDGVDRRGELRTP